VYETRTILDPITLCVIDAQATIVADSITLVEDRTRIKKAVDPTVSDNYTLGYEPGDMWMNTVSSKYYVLTFAGTSSTPNAHWEPIEHTHGTYVAGSDPHALPSSLMTTMFAGKAAFQPNGGYARLGADSKVENGMIPNLAITDSYTVTDFAARDKLHLLSGAEQGDVARVSAEPTLDGRPHTYALQSITDDAPTTNALAFDGVDDVVNLANPISVSGTAGVIVQTWVKTTGPAAPFQEISVVQSFAGSTVVLRNMLVNTFPGGTTFVGVLGDPSITPVPLNSSFNAGSTILTFQSSAAVTSLGIIPGVTALVITKRTYQPEWSSDMTLVGDSGSYLFQFGILNRSLHFSIYGADTAWHYYRGTKDVCDGYWHHVSLSYGFDGVNWKARFFIDGTLDAELTAVAPTSTYVIRTLGAGQDQVIPFNGSIADVRVKTTSTLRTVFEAETEYQSITSATGYIQWTCNQGSAGGDNSAETTLVCSDTNYNGTLTNFLLTSGTTSNYVSGFFRRLPVWVEIEDRYIGSTEDVPEIGVGATHLYYTESREEAYLSTVYASASGHETAAVKLLQGTISSEASSRLAGDAANSTLLSIEVAARSNAVTLEVSSRVSADTFLSTGVSAENSDMLAALSTEASSRVSGDTSVENSLSTEIYARTSDVSAEASSRTFADASLSVSLSSEVSSRVSTENIFGGSLSTASSSRVSGDVSLASDLSSEVYARASNDASVSQDISSELSTMLSSVAVKESSRISGDASVSLAISSEASTRLLSDTSLQTDLSSEVSTRTFADTSLALNVSTEVATFSADISSEISSRVLGDASLSTSLSSEASSKISGDASVSTSLSTEVSARISDVSAETSARLSADLSLSTDLSTEISTRASAISTETSSRTSGDASISTSLSTEVSGRAIAVSTEASSRVLGDASVTVSLSTEVFARASDVSSEVYARVSTDTLLSADLSSEISTRLATLTTGLAQDTSSEESSRLSADASISTLLSTEVSTRTAVVSSEISSRVSTDTVLTSGISSEISTTNADISSEISTRLFADNSLTTGLSAEASTRTANDTTGATAVSNHSTNLNNPHLLTVQNIISTENVLVPGAFDTVNPPNVIVYDGGDAKFKILANLANDGQVLTADETQTTYLNFLNFNPDVNMTFVTHTTNYIEKRTLGTFWTTVAALYIPANLNKFKNFQVTLTLHNSPELVGVVFRLYDRTNNAIVSNTEDYTFVNIGTTIVIAHAGFPNIATPSLQSNNAYLLELQMQSATSGVGPVANDDASVRIYSFSLKY
jgi:hypothetical protein